MKFQRNPTHARLLELLAAANHIAIDGAGSPAIGVDTDEQALVESVRDELATVIGAGWSSPAGAEELSDATFSMRRRKGSADCCEGSTHGDSIFKPSSVPTAKSALTQRDVHAGDCGVSPSTVVLRAIRAEKAAAA